MSSELAADTADLLEAGLLGRLEQAHRQPFVFGLCGAQGSGKSTLADALRRRLLARGLRTAVLSLDDLYLSQTQRRTLADAVHPMLRVRGPPGTHDVGLGLRLLAALGAAGPVALPRFDKATDTRRPPSEWEQADSPIDVVIFEGWMVGARPQALDDLVRPINALERDEDPQAVWRRWTNGQLAGPYQDLFARLDMLALLAAPGFHEVARWRRQQEEALRADLRARGASTAGTMQEEAIDRFVAYYQRLTEHIAGDMPSYADLVAPLDSERRLMTSDAPARGAARAMAGAGA